MFEPKIPAISASIGFVLSLLIGLTSGASFGVLILRAAGMALLFAGFTIIVRIIVFRFLPELLDGQSTDMESETDTGNAVDITIGESGEDDSLFTVPQQTEKNTSVPDFFESADFSDSGSDFTGDMRVSGTISSPEEKSSGLNGREKTGPKGSPIISDKPKTTGGLDVLPDLQDFIPQVTETNVEDDISGSDGSSMSDSLFSGAETTGITAESETMAKAIRTILAKDN